MRCPYCGSPLDEFTHDGEAFWCADCRERVEFVDAVEELDYPDWLEGEWQ